MRCKWLLINTFMRGLIVFCRWGIGIICWRCIINVWRGNTSHVCRKYNLILISADNIVLKMTFGAAVLRCDWDKKNEQGTNLSKRNLSQRFDVHTTEIQVQIGYFLQLTRVHIKIACARSEKPIVLPLHKNFVRIHPLKLLSHQCKQ